MDGGDEEEKGSCQNKTFVLFQSKVLQIDLVSLLEKKDNMAFKNMQQEGDLSALIYKRGYRRNTEVFILM